MMLAIKIIPAMQRFPAVALASNLACERRLKNQMIDAIMDGKPRMLTASGYEFPGIYIGADKPTGAMLDLHGHGYSINNIAIWTVFLASSRLLSASRI